MTLAHIGQIAFTVGDIERATAFYRDTLGMPLLFRAGALSFFGCGPVRLMLSEPEADASAQGTPPPARFSRTVVYWKVEGLDMLHGDLLARGVRFLDAPHLVARMPDHELWMTFLDDGEGNTLGLMEERRNSA